ncbi:MAG: hypothetical protein AAF485_10800, partial [Chloroflexota bacterium]
MGDLPPKPPGLRRCESPNLNTMTVESASIQAVKQLLEHIHFPEEMAISLDKDRLRIVLHKKQTRLDKPILYLATLVFIGLAVGSLLGFGQQGNFFACFILFGLLGIATLLQIRELGRSVTIELKGKALTITQGKKKTFFNTDQIIQTSVTKFGQQTRQASTSKGYYVSPSKDKSENHLQITKFLEKLRLTPTEKLALGLSIEKLIETFFGVEDTVTKGEAKLPKQALAAKYWAVFAKKEGLTFTSNNYPYHIGIAGTYRTYHLELTSRSTKDNFTGKIPLSVTITTSFDNEMDVTDITIEQMQRMLKTVPATGSLSVTNDASTPSFRPTFTFTQPETIVNRAELLKLINTFADLLDAYPAIIALEGEAGAILKPRAAQRFH